MVFRAKAKARTKQPITSVDVDAVLDELIHRIDRESDDRPWTPPGLWAAFRPSVPEIVLTTSEGISPEEAWRVVLSLTSVLGTDQERPGDRARRQMAIGTLAAARRVEPEVVASYAADVVQKVSRGGAPGTPTPCVTRYAEPNWRRVVRFQDSGISRGLGL